MNKTALITGATSGLGRTLARHFAVAGFDLVLHGRSEPRLAAVARATAALGASVRTVRADITEPDQVAAMAYEINDLAVALDVVVNNAAIGGGVDPAVREVNSNGHELRMAGNHLAPYLLNRLLAPMVAAAACGRIINIASLGQAPLDVDDLGFTHGYDGVDAYCRSKLALIMDTIDLASEVSSDGTQVNAVHPAHLMPTGMVRDSGFVPAATIEDGALPVLRLAFDTEVEALTGRYFDRFEVAEPHPQARDADVRSSLAAFASRAVVSAGVR